MKNLANCTPTEFLKQTVRLREPFRKWLDDTGIPEIRKRKPEGYDKMTQQQRAEAMVAQANANMSDMLAAAIDKDPDGTLAVIALCNFTEPADIDAHPMAEYLASILEMLNNEAVRSFFMLTLTPSRATSTEE